jgi:hypothetical protein
MRKTIAAAIMALALTSGCSSAPRGEIRLSLGNGKTVTFRDDAGGCDDGYEHCTVYRLLQAPSGCRCFPISEAHYEGGFYYLIDAETGRRTNLPYEPIFSADGKKILILNNDVTGDFPGDRIEIWRRQDDTAVKEWTLSPDSGNMGTFDYVWVIKLLRWDDDAIRLHLSSNDFKDRGGQLQPGAEWDGTLRHAADGWHAELRKPVGR